MRLLLFFMICAPGWGMASVYEYTLDNGLKLIVKEDHRAPVLVSQVWYKVGSSYEPNGITGVSHVLEHMMFKGTAKFGPGEFSKIIAAQGGRDNAFTGQDYTAYYQNLEKSRLKISFEMEADRMRNLKLTEDEYSKEIKVVMEERRLRTEDKPESFAFEHFNAVAFLNTPYRQPVIGWMQDLENLTVADLQKWYQKWYAPNNATVVVVGDVQPKEVLQLAKKYFGALKPGEISKIKPVAEAAQLGMRRIVVRRPAELPFLLMGYHVPVLTSAGEDWEPYALEILAGVLDGGESSRFKKHLVRELEIATAVSVSYDLNARLNDLFVMTGVAAKGKKIEDLEKALRGQIERLRAELISESEMQRIKTQVVANNVYERDSVYYQAMQIGILETVGLSWKIADEYVERIRKITPAQVMEVAKKYLIDDRLTVAILEPLPLQTSHSQTSQIQDGQPHVR